MTTLGFGLICLVFALALGFCLVVCKIVTGEYAYGGIGEVFSDIVIWVLASVFIILVVCISITLIAFILENFCHIKVFESKGYVE